MYFILRMNLKDLKPYTLNRKPSGELKELNYETIKKIITNIHQVNGEDRRELLGRVRFAQHKIPSGYYIEKEEDIVYMQWLVEPKDKAALIDCYPGRFQNLNNKQVMLENAFTYPRYRGMGYYYFISSKLLQKAKDIGYKYAVGYVRADKMDSFNAMLRLGFKVTHIQKEKKFLGMVKRETLKGKEF